MYIWRLLLQGLCSELCMFMSRDRYYEREGFLEELIHENFFVEFYFIEGHFNEVRLTRFWPVIDKNLVKD